MEAWSQVQSEATVKKQEIPFNEKAVDLDSEDIEDCMLVSIDLSNQQLPIARHIHNTEISLDDREVQDGTHIIVEEEVSKEIMVPNHHGNTATPDLCNSPSKTYGSITSVTSEATHTTVDGATCAVVKDEPIQDVCSPRTDVTFIKEEPETSSSTVNPMCLDIINVATVQTSAFDAMSSSFSTDETVIKDEPTTHGSTPIIRAPSPSVTIEETNVLLLPTVESANLPSNSDFIMALEKTTCSGEVTGDTGPLQAEGALNLPATSSMPIHSTSLTADFKAPVLHNDVIVPSGSVLTNTNSESLHAAGSLPAAKDLELVSPYENNIDINTGTFFPCGGQEHILIRLGGDSSLIHSQPASSHDMNVELAVKDCTSTSYEHSNTSQKNKNTVSCVVCHKQFESHHELTSHSELHRACGLPKTDDSQPIHVARHAGKRVIWPGRIHVCVTCGKTFRKRSYLRKHLKRNSCRLKTSINKKQHTAKQCLNAPVPGLNSESETIKLTTQNISSSLYTVDSVNSQCCDYVQSSLPIAQTHETTDPCLGEKSDKFSVTKHINDNVKHPPSNGLEIYQHCTLCMKKMTSADLEKHTEKVKSSKYSHIVRRRDVKNECSFCGEMFASKCDLIGHLCQTPQCEKYFDAVPVTEIPKYGGATTGSDNSEPASVNPAVGRFNHSFDNCGATFIDTKKLKEHQESCEHRSNMSDPVDAYKCLVCGRAFQTWSERTNHMSHDSKCQSVIGVKCLKCGQKFEFPDLKRVHLKEERECAAYEEENGLCGIQTVAIKRHFEASELSKLTSRSTSHSSVFVTNPSSVVASSSDQTAVTVSSKADETSFRTSGATDVSATESSVSASAAGQSLGVMLNGQPCLSVSSNADASPIGTSITKELSVAPTVRSTASSTPVVRCDTCSVWFTSYALLQRHFKQQPSCRKVPSKETAPDREKGQTYSELGTRLMKGPNICCFKCQRRFATDSMLDRHFSDSPKCKAKAGEDQQGSGKVKNVNSEGGNSFVYSHKNYCGESLVQNRTHSTDVEKCLQRACNDVTETVHSQENGDGLNTYNKKETESHEVKFKKNTSQLGTSSSPFKRNKHKRSSEDDSPSKNVMLKKPKIILDSVSIMCKSCKVGLKDDVALAAHLKQSESCSNGHDNFVTTGFPCLSSVCNKKFTSDDELAQHLQGSKNCQRNLDKNVCEENISKENLKATSVSFEATPVDNARASRKKEYVEGKDSPLSDSEDNSDSDSSSSSLESDENENVSDGEFKCKLCDKPFHHAHSLRKHMNKHSGEHQPQLVKKNKTRCRVCSRRLEDSTALQAHLIQHRFCFIAQAQKQWRKEYAKSESCRTCGKTFSSFKNLRRHCCKDMTCRLRYINSILEGCEKRDHKNKVKGKLLSDETADSETVKKENTVRTMKEVPDPQVSDKQHPGLSCKNCVKTFKNKTAFSLHFRNNDGCLNFYNDGAQECPVKIYYCARCERYFNTLYHKKRHVCASLRKKVLICQLCPYRFSSTTALACHLRQKHKQKLPISSGEKMMKSKAKLLNTQASFDSKKTKDFDKNLGSDTASEINTHLNLNLYSTFAEKTNHTCVECGLNFSQYDLFVSHVASHETAAPKGSEESHKNLEEVKKEIYSCFICKETFDELKKLTVHYEKSKCGSYTCDFCSVQFESSTALNKHQCHCGRRIENKTDSPETKASHVQIRVRLPETASDSAKTDLSFKSRHKNGEQGISDEKQDVSCDDSLQETLLPEKKKVLCLICNKTLLKSSSLNHFKCHIKNMFKVLPSKSSKPLTSFSKEKCPICRGMFLSRSVLKQHLLCHSSKDIITQIRPTTGHSSSVHSPLFDQSKETDYKMSTGVASLGESTLSEGTEKPKNSSGTGDDVELKSPVTAQTECPVCQRLFKGTSALKFHAKHVHPIEYMRSKSLFSAKKIENTGNAMVSEITTPGSCKLCHKKFTGTANFYDHIENSHPKRKMTNYMQFFKPFAQKENLNELLSKHIGTCKLCHKKFGTTKHFRNHVKTSHAKRNLNLTNCMRLFVPRGDMSPPQSLGVLSPLTTKQDVQRADNFKYQRSLIEVQKKEVKKLSTKAERPEQDAINSGQGKGQKQFIQEQKSVDSCLHQGKRLCTICNKMLLRSSFGNHFKYHLKTILQHIRDKSSKPLISFSKEKCPICDKLLSRKSLKVHLFQHCPKDIIAQSPNRHSVSNSLDLTQIKSEKDWKKQTVKFSRELSSESERKDSEKSVMADVAEAKSLSSSNIECPVCKRLFSRAATMLFHAKQSHPIEYLRRTSMFHSKKTEKARKVPASTSSWSCSAVHLKKTKDVLSMSSLPSSSSSVCAGNSFSGLNAFLGKAAKREYIGVCSICKKKILNFQSFKFHLKIQHNIINDNCEQFLAEPDNSSAKMEPADEAIESPKTKGQKSKKSVNVKKKTIQNLRDPSGSKKRKHMYTTCHLCAKSLKKYCYARHLTAAHGLAKSSIFSCQFCSGKFPNQQLFDEHFVHCEKEFVCPMCGKKFTFLKALKNHMCTVHKILYSTYVSMPKEEVTKNTSKFKNPDSRFQCVIETDNGGLVIRNHNDLLLEDLTSHPPNECQELQIEDSPNPTQRMLPTFQNFEETMLDKMIKSEDEEEGLEFDNAEEPFIMDVDMKPFQGRPTVLSSPQKGLTLSDHINSEQIITEVSITENVPYSELNRGLVAQNEGNGMLASSDDVSAFVVTNEQSEETESEDDESFVNEIACSSDDENNSEKFDRQWIN